MRATSYTGSLPWNLLPGETFPEKIQPPPEAPGTTGGSGQPGGTFTGRRPPDADTEGGEPLGPMRGAPPAAPSIYDPLESKIPGYLKPDNIVPPSGAWTPKSRIEPLEPPENAQFPMRRKPIENVPVQPPRKLTAQAGEPETQLDSSPQYHALAANV